MGPACQRVREHEGERRWPAGPGPRRRKEGAGELGQKAERKRERERF